MCGILPSHIGGCRKDASRDCVKACISLMVQASRRRERVEGILYIAHSQCPWLHVCAHTHVCVCLHVVTLLGSHLCVCVCTHVHTLIRVLAYTCVCVSCCAGRVSGEYSNGYFPLYSESQEFREVKNKEVSQACGSDRERALVAI